MKKILIIFILSLFLMPLVFAEIPSLTLINPQNNDLYGSKDVQVQLTADSKSLFYYAEIGNSGKWNKICPSFGLECSKKIKFKEGINDLLFKAVDSNGASSYTEEVIFTIDSVKPVILKISSNGAITKGDLFSVTYNKDDRSSGQEFMNEITLFYGKGDSIQTVSLSDCLTGMNQHCDFENVDVSSFEGETIDYWFNVSTLSHSVLSKKARVKVDTTAPEIEALTEGVNQIISSQLYHDSKNQVSSRKVKFILDITEANFDRVKYVDSNDCGYNVLPSQVLCTRLSVGRCVVTKNFCVGHHDLVITALDKAGNTGTIETSLDIDP